MRFRFIRAFVTLTTLAVVWLVSAPALAQNASLTSATNLRTAPMSTVPVPVDNSVPPTSRAPLCDPRGATTFAPPPQMQDVEVTLDTGLTLDDCVSSPTSREGRREGHRAAPGRAPTPLDATPSSDAAVITAVATLAASARGLLPVPVASTSCPRPGIRSTVDRPPRA